MDDNPTNLRLACDVLAYDGFDVLRATDADEARAVLGGNAVDLILMDIALPGMDGLELTRLLKADDAFEHIPIVALTAFAMKGDEARALDAGCVGYITKPIDTRSLSTRLAGWLGQC
ncbi:MAG: response regulator [Planctomycetota bacterium]